MTCVNAAHKVLSDDGGPLHYVEITRRIAEGGLWKTKGKTPDATVEARITVEIQNAGAKSRFVRVGFGRLCGRHN
jgi:restriction system protein